MPPRIASLSAASKKAAIERGMKLLTPAQLRVLPHILNGHPSATIARTLRLSIHTVNNHTRMICQAFHVTSRMRVMALFVIMPTNLQ